MDKSLIIIFLLFYSGLQFSFCQLPIQIWNESARLAKNKEWAQVIEKIKPHIFPPPNDTITPWLIQLYAYSNFMAGDHISATVSANRILIEYSLWSGIEETRLILGQLSFNKKKLKQAAQYWKNIPRSYEKRLLSIIADFRFQMNSDSIHAIEADSSLKNSFFAKQMSGKNENHQVWYHKVGTVQSADKLIYEDKNNLQRFHTASTSEDEKFLFLTLSDRGKGFDGNAIYAMDLTATDRKFYPVVP